MTQTLGMVFGSGFAVPGTGLVLNNILKWMDRDPASPNVLRPGKKAGTMMSPTQVFKDGAFALSIGTPGSYGILQTQPQMLLNVLEFGLNVQEAIEAPRGCASTGTAWSTRRPASPRRRARASPGAGIRSTRSRSGRGWWAAGRASPATQSRARSWREPTRGATATRLRSEGFA